MSQKINPENLQKNQRIEDRPDSKKHRLKTSHKKNHEFTVITYSFLVLFLCMMGYFAYFQFMKSEDFISSPYNKRQDLLAAKVVRGEILTADGYVLAETKTDAIGNETRYYPFSNMFSHVVGYATNGKSGIESSNNFDLLRSHTDFLEKLKNLLLGEKNIGDNIVTTLDYRLQSVAYDALGDYDGAVVVLEPSTGKILAMVSKPDYNPNTIANDWEYLTSEENNSSVLLNRASQGLYPPGSIFKVFTTLEYVHENPDYQTYQFQCTGQISSDSDDAVIHCYNNKNHGAEDLLQSFADSCNSSYASIGLSLDQEKFTDLCTDLLFNSELPLKFQYSKSSFSIDNAAEDSDIMQTAIGQGKTLVTPMHMAMVVSAIANDGVLMKPYLIDEIENYNKISVTQNEPEEYKKLLSVQDASLLQRYMEEVVQSGTGEKLSQQSYVAAGKTGSAEFSTTSKASHSWFIGYAEREDKETIAIAVVVENSGTGSKYAVPVAKKVFDAYYD